MAGVAAGWGRALALMTHPSEGQVFHAQYKRTATRIILPATETHERGAFYHPGQRERHHGLKRLTVLMPNRPSNDLESLSEPLITQEGSREGCAKGWGD